MPQLFAQQDRQPDVWVMSGAPTATVVYLSLDTTINYSSGSPDTLHANTPAVIYGTSDTAFDRSLDVWVPFTVRASGVLSIIKESLLATITADYVAMARVELHGIKPYQPEPYLASGGLGVSGGTSVAIVSDTSARARSLWNGSSNDAPPASWQTAGYDDSAWAAAVAASDPFGGTVPGSMAVWPSTTPTAVGQQALFRQHFTLPAGTVSGATLSYNADDDTEAIYVNGTALVSSEAAGGTFTVTVPPTALAAGGANVLAVWGRDNPPGGTLLADDAAWLSWKMVVSYAGTGAVVAPGGTPAEGDLLSYHGGAWTDLPIGTSGQELTVVSGAPAWATPAASGVTSIAVAAPAPLSSAGGPITTSGTITLSWASGQTANRVLASPDGTTGAVSLRALVGNDIPVDASTIISSAGTIKGNYQAGSGVSISGNTISATGSGGSVTSVALSMPGIFSVSGSPISTSGTLSVTLANENVGTVFAGPASGSAAAPTFRALQGSDLPAAAAAGGHIHAHGHFL